MIRPFAFLASIVFAAAMAAPSEAGPIPAMNPAVPGLMVQVQVFGSGNPAGPGQGAGPSRFQSGSALFPGQGQGASAPRFQSRVPLRIGRGLFGRHKDRFHRRGGKGRPRCRTGLHGRIVNAHACLGPRKRDKGKRRY